MDILTVATIILASATIYLAYQTHALVRFSMLLGSHQSTREHNWKLFENRDKVKILVAPELTPKEWKWRITILHHLNSLQFQYQRHDFGLLAWLRRMLGREPNVPISVVNKSTRAMAQVKCDATGREQLRQLLSPGEGFPQQFIDWMIEQNIITRADLLHTTGE